MTIVLTHAEPLTPEEQRWLQTYNRPLDRTLTLIRDAAGRLVAVEPSMRPRPTGPWHSNKELR